MRDMVGVPRLKARRPGPNHRETAAEIGPEMTWNSGARPVKFVGARRGARGTRNGAVEPDFLRQSEATTRVSDPDPATRMPEAEARRGTRREAGRRVTARNSGAGMGRSRRTGVDMFSPERRSEIMGRIGPKDTKPERLVRSLLHRLGYRFRLHRRDLPGRPDVVLPRYRTAVLVHGCYWHLHEGCPAGRLPTANQEFWRKKLEGNRVRDRRNEAALRRLGWRVVVLWECEIERDLVAVGRRLRRRLARPEPARKAEPRPTASDA